MNGPLLDRGHEPTRISRPFGRLAVTLAAAAFVQLSGRIPLPGLDLSAAGAAIRGGDVSVLAVGLIPVVTAFVIVELAALAVPAWRRLRVTGRPGRARLDAASIRLGALLACVQAWSLTGDLRSIGALPGDLAVRALAAVTLVAGSAGLVWLASWAGRYGLANGYSVLFVAGTLTLRFASVPKLTRALAATPEVSTLALVAGAAVSVAIQLGVAIAVLQTLVANDREPRPGLQSPRLRDPASGLVPLSIAESLLIVPPTLSGWFPSLRPLSDAVRPGSAVFDGLLLALAGALGLVLARLFNRPAKVAEVWARIGGAPPCADIAGRAEAALRPARRRALVLFALIVLVPAMASPVWIQPGAITALAFAFAAVADVLGEWRARCRSPDLVPVWSEPRLYAADAGLAALAAAGIPAFARGVHYRTLGQFFAPYVPVELLVPGARAVDAELALRRVLASAAPDPAWESAPRGAPA